MELDQLTPEHFEPLVGERFAVAAGADGAVAGELALVLTAVERLPPHGHRAAPFSLAFRGGRTPVLPQQIHHLEHPRLGRLEVFLVPIRGDASGIVYEAILN